MSETTGPLVLLKQGDLELAISLDSCVEVHRNMQITPVLGGSSAEGVINLRGRLIPVVDLELALGATSKQSVLRRRIVICQSDSDQIGLLCDDVFGITEVTHELRRRPTTFPEGLQCFCRGITQVGGRLCFLLDVGAFLTGQRTTDRGEVS